MLGTAEKEADEPSDGRTRICRGKLNAAGVPFVWPLRERNVPRIVRKKFLLIIAVKGYHTAAISIQSQR